MALTIKKNLLPSSKYSIKSPYTMTPIGICVHNTANDASAENEIAYMVRNDLQVSFHYAVDDIQAVQGLPENRNGWHAGDGGSGTGNRKYIAIEICYSKSGGDRFIKAEQNAVLLIVDILKRYGWGVDKVKKHQDFSGKYCPHRTLDMGWQRFLNMVSKELAGNSWKEDAKILPEGKRIFVANKDTALYNIDTKAKIKDFPKGSELDFICEYAGYYITGYSFDRNIKNGIPVADMTLKTEPLPDVPPAPPEPDPKDKEIQELKKEIEALKIDLAASGDRCRVLEEEVVEYKKDYEGLSNKYDTLHIEKNRIENEKNEAIAKLKECGSLSGASAGDMIAELWRRLIRALNREA